MHQPYKYNTTCLGVTENFKVTGWMLEALRLRSCVLSYGLAFTQEGSYAAYLSNRMEQHGIPLACQDLIIGLLQLRESRRMSISAALQHPWILQS